VNATTQSATSDTITFYEPNYTTRLVCYTYKGNHSAYRFIVTPPPGYEAFPSAGVIIVGGNTTTVTVEFKKS
jgi:hypothetical protein